MYTVNFFTSRHLLQLLLISAVLLLIILSLAFGRKTFRFIFVFKSQNAAINNTHQQIIINGRKRETPKLSKRYRCLFRCRFKKIIVLVTVTVTKNSEFSLTVFELKTLRSGCQLIRCVFDQQRRKTTRFQLVAMDVVVVVVIMAVVVVVIVVVAIIIIAIK